MASEGTGHSTHARDNVCCQNGISVIGMNKSKAEELDEIAVGYDPSDPTQFFDYWFKRFEAEASQPWLRGERVLELGGATGESASLIAPLCGQYVIVEGSPVNCDIIRKRLPDVEVIEGYWEEFEPSEKFSDIILFETLEHYSDPVSLLFRCRRWLADGGRIHVSVPNGNSLHRQAAVHMGLQNNPLEVNANDSRQGHLRNYSREAMENDILSAGLHVVHSQGLYLKVVPNSMMLNWDEPLLRAINALGATRIDDAAELFFVCEATEQ